MEHRPGRQRRRLGRQRDRRVGLLLVLRRNERRDRRQIINACAFFHKAWFFAAGATNVGVDLKVTDTLTGQVRTYHNATDAPFQPILDTEAFGGCPVS
jgi:hypothetical protein